MKRSPENDQDPTLPLKKQWSSAKKLLNKERERTALALHFQGILLHHSDKMEAESRDRRRSCHDTICFGLQTVPDSEPSGEKRFAYCTFKYRPTLSITFITAYLVSLSKRSTVLFLAGP